MTQPTKRPHRKVAAVGAGGTAATAIVVILHAFGVDLPVDVVAAALTLVSFGAGYLKN